MRLSRLFPYRSTLFGPSFSYPESARDYQARTLYHLTSGRYRSRTQLIPSLAEGSSQLSRNARPPLVYHEDYSIPWPAAHRFCMGKFRNMVKIGKEEGIIDMSYVQAPEPLEDNWVHGVHCPQYYQQFCEGTLSKEKMRRIGFPWSEELVKRTKLECAGTVTAAKIALRTGMALNLGGGTHHAFRDYGSGFTILNDLAMAANVLLSEEVSSVLIVDLDVHQGDGTASIFAEDDRVFTLSAHGASNFPFRKQESDLDIPLRDGIEDQEYMAIVLSQVENVVQKFRPELILYDAGVDVHEKDELGRLQVSDDGLLERDSFVFSLGLKYGCPIASVIGGGYQRDHTALARRHLLVVTAANEVWDSQKVGLAQWN